MVDTFITYGPVEVVKHNRKMPYPDFQCKSTRKRELFGQLGLRLRKQPVLLHENLMKPPEAGFTVFSNSV